MSRSWVMALACVCAAACAGELGDSKAITVEGHNGVSVLDAYNGGTVNFPAAKISFKPDGRVIWKGHEVKGDDDFKAAMIDLDAVLKGVMVQGGCPTR